MSFFVIDSLAEIGYSDDFLEPALEEAVGYSNWQLAMGLAAIRPPGRRRQKNGGMGL